MSVGIQKAQAKVRDRRLSNRRSTPAALLAASGTLRDVAVPETRRGLLSTLVERVSERLGPHEFRRRLVHMAPGLLPLIVIAVPHSDPMSWRLKALVYTTTIWLTLFSLLLKRLFTRRHEQSQSWTTSVLSYAVIVFSMLTLLPGQPELGFAVMAILAFGDGSATLVGLLVKGRKLPWNQAKSWSGFWAFLGCAIPMATLMYWGESQPAVPLSIAVLTVAPAVLVAALAESIPVRMNDNIRVGVASAVTIVATHGMFVGW